MKFSIGLKRRPRSISCRRFIEAQASHLFEGCLLRWLRYSMSIQLTAMAIDSMDDASFAAILDRAIARSQAPPKMIDTDPAKRRRA